MKNAMTADTATHEVPERKGPDLDQGMGAKGLALFGIAVCALIAFVAYSVYADAASAGVQAIAYLPFVLLFVALLIALGFEFVNGFHDTANAVATVIYTHSMPANFAVIWSGFFNFLGVILSSGAVAFGIVSLLPVELILHVGDKAGFAMVFALLIAAIVWNLATWFYGLPSSSSHTLIGSIIGVGVANALMNGQSGTSGVDWGQATQIGYALLLSPIVGFGGAALLFLALKTLVRNKALYEEPKGNKPPPLWIRALLIFTCTGVSFAHGSNDGQKGMGLIMLILIGTVPTAYALNTAVPTQYIADFRLSSDAAAKLLTARAGDKPVPTDTYGPITRFIQEKTLADDTIPAVAALISDVAAQVEGYGSLAAVPQAETKNVRNDMYLASEAVKHLNDDKTLALSDDEKDVLKAYKGSLDAGTRFIPTWVKIAVAVALGLGTMIGWKRIVVTVGEKIGKTHLTYGQGASAELVAMATIGAADAFGLPVSTTHVLSSGVAGTMVANKAGLQLSTLRNLAAAWVLTLPVSILLSGTLYFLFSQIF